VLFSDNITDRMLGNRAMMERLCNSLWVERGKVSEMAWSASARRLYRHVRPGAGLLVNNLRLPG
jgi:[NiFe] hydrogenase diaphorase moiety large subunit